MTMISFRVDDDEAARAWSKHLEVDRSGLLRDALRRHLDRLAAETDDDAWAKQPLDDGERSFEVPICPSHDGVRSRSRPWCRCRASTATGRCDERAADVTQRAANTRAGYVYVISNAGSMGPVVVKVGMTRRLDPMDRVRELGDASVPFRFSVHALVFSDDAVSLEAQLHRQFAEHRVNRVNLRRELFRASPAAVCQALVEADAHLVEWDEAPMDEEWEASQ